MNVIQEFHSERGRKREREKEERDGQGEICIKEVSMCTDFYQYLPCKQYLYNVASFSS